VTTHLDVTPPFAIQRAQAAEAVQSATRPTLPIVFVGDFNSVADEPRHIDRGRYVSRLSAHNIAERFLFGRDFVPARGHRLA